MLVTMSPEDSEKIKEAGQMTPELMQSQIEKAMTQSTKFNATYNDIPVFAIAQMRMRKEPAEGEEGEPVQLLPFYFSLQNMVGTWQQFMSQASPEMQGIEPAINLLSLHELVDLAMKDSEIDFRHVVLVPSVPDSASKRTSTTAEDPMAQMGGATLGDV